jgi:3,5-epimerase/4-reductase
MSAPRYLVFGGKTGWIGQKVLAMLQASGIEAKAAEARLEKLEAVAAELDAYKPTHVLNCAGLTGRPNVDWCEDHKDEVIRVNLIGTLGLLDACETRGIHCTNFATGCIFNYDFKYPVDGAPIPEAYPPNYVGSFYSLTKGMVDTLSWNYKNVLTLRLRMPISDDLSPRNFVTKISSYAKVIDVQNSVTVLHDMLPVALAMADRKITGMFNFTNPGTVSHNEVLDLFTKHIEPGFKYANFTEEDQAKILKAGRCNNNLDVAKLVAAVPDMAIPGAKEAVEGVFVRMRKDMEAAGTYPPPPRKA